MKTITRDELLNNDGYIFNKNDIIDELGSKETINAFDILNLKTLPIKDKIFKISHYKLVDDNILHTFAYSCVKHALMFNGINHDEEYEMEVELCNAAISLKELYIDRFNTEETLIELQKATVKEIQELYDKYAGAVHGYEVKNLRTEDKISTSILNLAAGVMEINPIYSHIIANDAATFIETVCTVCNLDNAGKFVERERDYQIKTLTHLINLLSYIY